MKRINVLDQGTSNKIAAGEVVERPSSVVKELVENSIDAGAKNITIEIENGGTTLIRIIDDGHGIHKEDIEKAFMPHATSKISKVEDIYSINTLGFRGEALPSIASVAKVTLKSKPQSEDIGMEINIEGGEVKYLGEGACNDGTLIEVKDIFYNVPARLKFLKTSSREGALINDIITRIALSNPQISFKLYNSGKRVVQTLGTGKIIDVIRTIYGKNISQDLIYFEDSTDMITLYGYIGKEEIARGSRNNQSIFVNGRYIKNKTLTAAVENAFKSFATVSKFPFFVLFVEVYPEFVDVNIHPTKAEIKFKDDRGLFKKVFDAVHKSFRQEVFNSFSVPEEEYNKNEDRQEVEVISFDYTENENNYNATSNDIILPNNNKEDETKVKITDIENVTLDNVKKEEDIYKSLRDSIFNNDNKREEVNIPVDFTNKDYIYEDNKDFTFKNENSLETETIVQKTLTVQGENHNNESNSLNNCTSPISNVVENRDNTLPKTNENNLSPKFPMLRVIGQFNKTYILGEHNGILYIIDQHAAHEKILFEKYLKDIENNNMIIQPLLTPVLLHLSIDDFCTFEEQKDVFTKAGFIVEDFGGNTIALKEVPYILGRLEPKTLFLNILDNLKALGTGKTSEVKYNKIASMACRAAVKANDVLTNVEMEKLISDLRYINDPFHCPHGRPIIIKFTDYELDKKFRRIV